MKIECKLLIKTVSRWLGLSGFWTNFRETKNEAIFLQFLKWLQINLYFIAKQTKWLDFTTFIILVKTDY